MENDMDIIPLDDNENETLNETLSLPNHKKNETINGKMDTTTEETEYEYFMKTIHSVFQKSNTYFSDKGMNTSVIHSRINFAFLILSVAFVIIASLEVYNSDFKLLSWGIILIINFIYAFLGILWWCFVKFSLTKIPLRKLSFNGNGSNEDENDDDEDDDDNYNGDVFPHTNIRVKDQMLLRNTTEAVIIIPLVLNIDIFVNNEVWMNDFGESITTDVGEKKEVEFQTNVFGSTLFCVCYLLTVVFLLMNFLMLQKYKYYYKEKKEE